MNIDIDTYRARIGNFFTRNFKIKGRKNNKKEGSRWATILILAVLLIIGGVEINPGPTMAEMDEKLNKITDMLANHSLEINKKFENFTKEWKDMKLEVDSIKNELENVKEQVQVVKMWERSNRNHNIIIFGCEEDQNETKWDLCCNVLDMFAREMQLNLGENVIDDCYRLGKRNIKRPILVKFNSILAKDAVLDRTRLLRGTRIRIDRDYDYITRMKRKELLHYLWEARKNGQRARLVFDKININGRLLDLEYCRRNLNQGSYGNHREEARTSITAKNGQEQRGQATSPRQSNGGQQQPPETGNGETGRRSSQMTTTRVSRNDDASDQRPVFQLGGRLTERTSYMDQREYNEGNIVDRDLETVSSPQGSIVRINRNMNISRGSYNLRNWMVKRQ